MESEYVMPVMLETFTESQPADRAEEVTDAATVSSLDMDRLNQEADAASTALRHAEDEACLAFWLRVHFQNLEDANKGKDIPVPDTAAGEAPSVPGASGQLLEGLDPLRRLTRLCQSLCPNVRRRHADRP